MRTSTLRSALSGLGVVLVLAAGAAPGVALCGSGPHGPMTEMAAMDSHDGTPHAQAPAPPRSLSAWSAGMDGSPAGVACCLVMSSCTPPNLVLARPVRIGTGDPRSLASTPVSLVPEHARPAPESPPPKA